MKRSGEFVQFVVGSADGDAGVEFAGVNDGAGGGDNLADGFGGAPGENCAADEANENNRGHDQQEHAPKRLEVRFTIVRDATDPELGAVGEDDAVAGVVFFGVLGGCGRSR